MTAMRTTAHRIWTTLGLGSAALLATAAPAYAQDTEPAGGAEMGQVVGASAGAAIASAALLGFGIAHRNGKTQLLQRVADFAGRVGSLPAWVALPSFLGTVSLLTALFGMYWDISLHIDQGRDAGPLANPAHYFILVGLFGITAAGFIAIVIPRERPSPTAVRLAPGWYAPLGGIMMLACGSFALIAFPLDDVWHRLFGQDVTLWSPTHLMLIGGAGLSLIGQAVLLVEGRRAGGRPTAGLARWESFLRVGACSGGFLIGLSTFQAEFDFGVPQFAFVLQPLLIALAASVALVMARVWGGPGTALFAAVFFLVVRGVIGLLVGPVIGETWPAQPLFLAEAALVELVALVIARERPIALGAVAGLLIGTVGVAAEWGWSHAVTPLPWPGALLPEAIPLALVTAIAGGVIGGWMGSALRAKPQPLAGATRFAAPAAAAAIFVCAVVGIAKAPDEGVVANVKLQKIQGGAERTVSASIRVDPPEAADDAAWVQVLAWQGGGRILDRLEKTGDGAYRTTEPIPVHGSWKAVLRLHSGASLIAAPIYQPVDTAIPAPETPASPSFTREFVSDSEIVQREAKGGGALVTGISYAVVAAIVLSLFALLAWGIGRMRSEGQGSGPHKAPGAATPTPHPVGSPS